MWGQFCCRGRFLTGQIPTLCSWEGGGTWGNTLIYITHKAQTTCYFSGMLRWWRLRSQKHADHLAVCPQLLMFLCTHLNLSSTVKKGERWLEVHHDFVSDLVILQVYWVVCYYIFHCNLSMIYYQSCACWITTIYTEHHTLQCFVQILGFIITDGTLDITIARWGTDATQNKEYNIMVIGKAWRRDTWDRGGKSQGPPSPTTV